MSRIINFDHAAASPLLPEVIASLEPYFQEIFGNPSSVHGVGQRVKKAVEEAREKVAALIHATPEEVVFTASGSEANNFAIKGVAFANQQKGKHLILSAIEHFSVLHAARSLEKMGFQVTLIPVDKDGLIDPEAVKAAITKQTILISVQHANHEVGTIEPIEKVAAIAHEKGILFHTDAIQTVGILPVDVQKMDVDFLSLSAQTFYGPQGAAALYVKKGLRIIPLIDGGIQEGGRRAGTENVAAIVGMGTAAALAQNEMESRIHQLLKLRDKLTHAIPAKISHTYLHGHPELRLPNNVNYGFEFIEGESILLFLGMSNIIASSGSACTSKALKASHVLSAMGVSHAIANGTILFSLGIDNTEADVDLLIEKLPAIVDRLRAMSPLYKK